MRRVVRVLLVVMVVVGGAAVVVVMIIIVIIFCLRSVPLILFNRLSIMVLTLSYGCNHHNVNSIAMTQQKSQCY